MLRNAWSNLDYFSIAIRDILLLEWKAEDAKYHLWNKLWQQKLAMNK